MATEAAIGKRRAEAVARIEAKAKQLAGGRVLHLPTHSRYGTDLLLVLQLEVLADFLEQIQARERARPNPEKRDPSA